MSEYNRIINEYKSSGLDNKTLEILEAFEDVMCELHCKNKVLFWSTMRDLHETFRGKHFNEIYAKYEVEKMFHTGMDGRKHTGEKISHSKAEEIYSKHKSLLSDQNSTTWDIYVAVNMHYHNKIVLYKQWFNELNEEMLHEKIVESAICEYFKDEDYINKHKIWEHFK